MTDAIYYRSVDCICVYAENLLGCDRLCLLFFFADWVPSYPRRCCWMRWATQSWWAWCGRHRCTCMKRGKAFNAWQGSYWTETTRTKWRESVMHWQRPQDVTKSECWEACSVAQYDSLLIHLPLMESSDAWPTSLLYHASVKTENSSRPLLQSFLLLTQSWVADMGAPLLCISTSLPVLVQTWVTLVRNYDCLTWSHPTFMLTCVFTVKHNTQILHLLTTWLQTVSPLTD